MALLYALELRVVNVSMGGLVGAGSADPIAPSAGSSPFLIFARYFVHRVAGLDVVVAPVAWAAVRV
jgi:hypothetical protein